MQRSGSKSKTKNRRKSVFEASSGNVFVDLGYPTSEAVNIVTRLNLMIQIERIIKRNGWTQNEAAVVLGLSQSRVCELMKSRTEKFTVDKLMLLLDKLGKEVKISIRDKAK
ncbi:XRE family transcriptional regulator [bacterium]|nr:XRE family transcriptional regulator [bacterium]